MEPEIETYRDEEGAHIAVGGALTIGAYDALVDAVKQLAPAADGLIIHLAGLRSIDSAGMGLLLLARELAQTPWVRIRDARDAILRSLHAANFGQMFVIE